MKSGLNLQGAQARLRFLVSEILLNCAKKVLFFESRASAPCRFSCCQLCEIFSFFFPERIFTFLVSIFSNFDTFSKKRGVFFVWRNRKNTIEFCPKKTRNRLFTSINRRRQLHKNPTVLVPCFPKLIKVDGFPRPPQNHFQRFSRPEVDEFS